jgi:cysteine/O-acetylserine efflux protein
MTEIDYIPLATFVLVTTFTPGPNNITCASLGILHGYRVAVRFIAGVITGFFLFMLVCAGLSSLLLNAIPSLEPILRFAGAIYILWLAFDTFRAGYALEGEEGHRPMGFYRGFFLQFLNPKAVVYGLTIYTVFLTPISGQVIPILTSAIVLSIVTYTATSVWALSGATLRKYIRRPKIRRTVGVVLALLLVYTAADLSGLLS